MKRPTCSPPPPRPYIYIEPQEFYDKANEVSIPETSDMSLQDFLKNLPEGATPENIRFYQTIYDGNDYGNDHSYISIFFITREKTPNYKSLMKTYQHGKAIYDKQMIEYDKNMKKYEKDHAKYIEECKVYNDWYNSQELRRAKQELKKQEEKVRMLQNCIK